MVKIRIKEPIWKSRSIGVPLHKITGTLEVKILYKDKFGNKTFPSTYVISREEAMGHRTCMSRKGMLYKEIPIVDMHIESGVCNG